MTRVDVPDYEPLFATAVESFWHVRDSQTAKQRASGKVDAGTRGAVTGGKHLDAIALLIRQVMVEAGLEPSPTRTLPGYYRRTKNWDVIALYGPAVAAVVELKGQIGSIGNNANNRIEEMTGQAADLWMAHREGLLGEVPPWFGYLVLVEDSVRSRRRASEPASPPRFPPHRVFTQTDYIERYAIALSRLREERQMNEVCLVASSNDGRHWYPDETMTFQSFATSIHARARALQAELGDVDKLERQVDAAARHRVERLPSA